MNAPCYKCEFGAPGCHDPKICKPWADYVATNEAKKKALERQRIVDGLLFPGYIYRKKKFRYETLEEKKARRERRNKK